MEKQMGDQKKFYSQIGQDQYYIEKISNRKERGTFLDVGAYDGKYNSNTYALEKNYGWTGICVEANPDLIPSLVSNRPNSVVANCAAWKEPSSLTLEVPLTSDRGVYGDELSVLKEVPDERVQDCFRDFFDRPTKSISVEAKTITAVIKESMSSRPLYVFDYASIDTEGSELEVLMGIDFSIVQIRFLTIEHGHRREYLNRIDGYLRRFGYVRHRLNKHDAEFKEKRGDRS